MIQALSDMNELHPGCHRVLRTLRISKQKSSFKYINKTGDVQANNDGRMAAKSE
jgi:hypothetical protein